MQVNDTSIPHLLDDDTRVRLQKGSNDYINANLVQVPWAKRTYILTQVNHWISFGISIDYLWFKGPLQTTSEHFWQMVWEQNSRVIIMLTRLIEKGSVGIDKSAKWEYCVFRINVGCIIRIMKMKVNWFLMKWIWK